MHKTDMLADRSTLRHLLQQLPYPVSEAGLSPRIIALRAIDRHPYVSVIFTLIRYVRTETRRR